MKIKNIATFYAILAALYAINVPFSKLLLNVASPTMTAAFLYLGAGAGMFLFGLFQRTISEEKAQERLTKKELPYTVAMVVLDIAAPIFLLFGIRMSTTMCTPIRICTERSSTPTNTPTPISTPTSTARTARLTLTSMY